MDAHKPSFADIENLTKHEDGRISLKLNPEAKSKHEAMEALGKIVLDREFVQQKLEELREKQKPPEVTELCMLCALVGHFLSKPHSSMSQALLHAGSSLPRAMEEYRAIQVIKQWDEERVAYVDVVYTSLDVYISRHFDYPDD